MTTELRQRLPEIRSKALRDSARGAPCMLEFPCCNHDPETTVWCHWDDDSFGMARKANDTSGFPGCSSCHRFLDVEWAGRMSLTLVQSYVIRALQRTFLYLLEAGVVSVKLDAVKTFHDTPAKPRTPRSERKSIPQRQDAWPQGRKIPSRPKHSKAGSR